MYPAIHAKNGDLKHSHECKMTFGKKDPNCPRCAELINGSAPREGWQKSYYKAQEAFSNDVAKHFSSHRHLSGGCGAVCTFGDY